MTPRSRDPGVLDAFASAFLEDRAALARYVARHPDHASDLIAYAHELELQDEGKRDAHTFTQRDEAWITSKVAEATRAEAPDPFAKWGPADYTSARKQLGVPSPVLAAFRDRVVVPSSVPLAFLDRLTTALGVSLSDVASFLRGPPRLSPALSHKSDSAPLPPSEKISFGTVLADAGMPAEQVATLLEEDD